MILFYFSLFLWND